MTIKLKELKVTERTLTKVFNAPFENAKLAYSIMKTSKKVLSELEDMEKMRFKLIEKYGELGKYGRPVLEGNQFKLKDPKGFEKEWKSFLETEIELDVWMLPFEAIENVRPPLSIAELSTIDKFINEEQRKEEIKEAEKPPVPTQPVVADQPEEVK